MSSGSVGQTRPGAVPQSVGDAQRRHRMIQEAAYSLYERGGFVHGHDLDDWLAAEAYIDSSALTDERSRQPEPAEPEVQQSGSRSIARDEALKRIVKQHPQRDMPQVESIESRDIPSGS